MLRNNLLTAWRSILKNKLQTSINIIGLAIGIAGCLVVFLLANYELGYNKGIVDDNRIYRVITQFTAPFEGLNAGVPTGLVPQAAEALQGTEVQCMMHTIEAKAAIPSDAGEGFLKKFEPQKDILVTGPEYFDLIQNYEWLAGSPRQSLSQPHQVVLTEEKARFYFGLKDPAEAIGRTIIYQDSLTTLVTGILKTPEINSDFHFTDFISAKTIPGSFLKEQIILDDWNMTSSANQLFIKAGQGVTAEVLTAQLETINKQINTNKKPDDLKSLFQLQPLTDLHFNQELGVFNTGRGPAHKPTLISLMLVAGLLLLIASVNFINLATVQATLRSKETGVRKVIGASRRQLTMQFLVETALLTLLALPVSVALTEFAIRFFDEFLPDGLQLVVWSPEVLAFSAGAIMLVTFLAGLYPSFVMSSFHPVFAIKNQAGNVSGRKSVGLRKGLTVFQFVLAQAFIIGALLIGRQIKYVLQKDLGFDKDAIVYFYVNWKAEDSKKLVFQQELEKLPEVKATSIHNKPPMESGYQTAIIEFEKQQELIQSEVHFRWVDTAYLSVFDIRLLAGRNLFPSDSIREILINESLAREMDFIKPEDALGKFVTLRKEQYPIVGVVKDFHVRSLHHAIPPMVMTTGLSTSWTVAAKISTTHPLSASIEKFRAVHKEVYQDADFDYHFMNESIEKLYATEIRTAKLVNTATGLAILISCLGLFGLAFFSVTQRSKEISIRKVLGASISGVVALLSKDFLKPVLIAFILASPIAYYFGQKWLSGFAYRLDLEWWVFALAGLIAIAIAFLTVGFQSMKAALADPVKSLRNE